MIAIVNSATVVSPDSRKTIPYPEVMNLESVPIFDGQGIVAQKSGWKRQKSLNFATNPSC
jgi:hypothetical protein